MNKDAKRTYYSKVNPTEAGKKKTFWKTFKPLFSSTCTATDKIILAENEAILTDDKEVTECFNSYFANIVESLNIPPEAIEEYERSPDPVVDAINKYASHPSIKKIKDMHGTDEKFEFSDLDPTQVFCEIYRLDKSKKTSGDIPVDMLRLAANHCYKEITHLINSGIKNSTFPVNLKLADLSPCFEAGDSTTKKNFLQVFKSPKSRFHVGSVYKKGSDLRPQSKRPFTATYSQNCFKRLKFNCIRGSFLWNTMSDEIKSSQSIAAFKRKIKSWNGDDCNCNICN